MKKTVFMGAGVALVTPMNEKGVDFEALGNLIDFQIENGTDALFVCCTTGEAPTLEDGEHLDIIEYAVERAAKRVPIIAGTGSNNTAHAEMMSKEAFKRGADGLLWVTPYYNKTSQRGLVKHYETLAASVDLPALLYNVPSRTGVDLSLETVLKLVEIENIVGIKEASGNVARGAQIVAEAGDKIDVYSGNDDIIVPMMSVGAKGVVSVISNIMPKEIHEMCSLCLENKFLQAGKIQLKLERLISALFCEANPMPVKTALNIMGLNAGILRLPLCEMSDGNREFLKREMRAQGLSF